MWLSVRAPVLSGWVVLRQAIDRRNIAKGQHAQVHIGGGWLDTIELPIPFSSFKHKTDG